MAPIGSSNAPGTRITVIRSCRTPAASSTATSAGMSSSPGACAAAAGSGSGGAAGSGSGGAGCTGGSSGSSGTAGWGAACSADAGAAGAAGSALVGGAGSSAGACGGRSSSRRGCNQPGGAATGASGRGGACASSGGGSSPGQKPPPALTQAPRRSCAADTRKTSASFALRLELEILMVQLVAELIPLGGQIANVLGMRRHLDRHLLGHLEAVRLEAGDLLRVVRQEAQRRDPQVGEDLVADAPLPLVGGEAEGEVRVDRVEAPLLQLVGLQLVEQADAAPLLRHVEEHPSAFGGDRRKRRLELLAAVAAQRVEDVTREALGVDAHEHVLADLAHHEREVLPAGERLAE